MAFKIRGHTTVLWEAILYGDNTREEAELKAEGDAQDAIECVPFLTSPELKIQATGKSTVIDGIEEAEASPDGEGPGDHHEGVREGDPGGAGAAPPEDRVHSDQGPLTQSGDGRDALARRPPGKERS